MRKIKEVLRLRFELGLGQRQIARTATKLAKPNPGTTLGSVRPFDNAQAWQPAPFQSGSQTTDLGTSTAPKNIQGRWKPSPLSNQFLDNLSIADNPSRTRFGVNPYFETVGVVTVPA